MNEAPHARRPLRSVGAIVGGFIAVVILSVGTDAIMHRTGVFPPSGTPMSNTLFALAVMYRTVFTVAGGYIAARLAPDRPVWHAGVLGVVGVVAATTGTVATWNKGPEFGEHWYPITLILLAFPSCWLGGKLSAARRVDHVTQ